MSCQSHLYVERPQLIPGELELLRVCVLVCLPCARLRVGTNANGVAC